MGAYQKRTEYSGILGGKVDLKIKDYLGTSTDRNADGDSWDKNIDEIRLPMQGTSPTLSPGWTLYKAGETPSR